MLQAAMFRVSRVGASRAAVSVRHRSALARRFDIAIVGGGHNGLVAAAYLQKAGKKVVVLERRHLLGGAAVTEEIIPGFHFSRASYVLSLLRPQVMRDLQLKKHGLKMYSRDPVSYTPVLDSGKSLTLWQSMHKTQREIAQFSAADARVYPKYEDFMAKMAASIDPLLDEGPIELSRLTSALKCGNVSQIFSALRPLRTAAKVGLSLGPTLPQFWELITAPASKILERWFESEPLKATLATDAVIGEMASPHTPGSGYVLLHHVMGDLQGLRNVWAYVEGGMGSVSKSIASAAKSLGATLVTEAPVSRILLDDKQAVGVVLEDGQEIMAKAVLSNATPKVTFLDLLDQSSLSEPFLKEVRSINYTSPVTKINVALSGLPNFRATPNTSSEPLPHHQCSIHINCASTGMLDDAYQEAAVHGRASTRPMMELCIASSLDPTLAPPGCHVASLFTQYTPYHLEGREWTEEDRASYADRVFDCLEEYAPGFRKLVVGYDILTPPDLERVFGLTGGNIFHGGMPLDQLYLSRPVASSPGYRTPVKGLYLCGSGTHPGGGVMGSPGRLCAGAVLEDWANTTHKD